MPFSASARPEYEECRETNTHHAQPADAHDDHTPVADSDERLLGEATKHSIDMHQRHPEVIGDLLLG